MGRWTQFEEDSARLPEGVKRIGYDADTARYKFCDQEGNLYLGPPNEEYGFLTHVGKTSRPVGKNDRPQAFAESSSGESSPTLSGRSSPALSVQIQPPGSGQTFHDFLPAHLITSPSSAESTLSDSPTGEGSTRSRLRDVVRRATLPAMQNVVNNMRRSTTVRKPKDSEKKSLLRSGSQASSKMTRSNTSATTSTFQGHDDGASH